jgi:hypothetical protein
MPIKSTGCGQHPDKVFQVGSIPAIGTKPRFGTGVPSGLTSRQCCVRFADRGLLGMALGRRLALQADRGGFDSHLLHRWELGVNGQA